MDLREIVGRQGLSAADKLLKLVPNRLGVNPGEVDAISAFSIQGVRSRGCKSHYELTTVDLPGFQTSVVHGPRFIRQGIAILSQARVLDVRIDAPLNLKSSPRAIFVFGENQAFTPQVFVVEGGNRPRIESSHSVPLARQRPEGH